MDTKTGSGVCVYVPSYVYVYVCICIWSLEHGRWQVGFWSHDGRATYTQPTSNSKQGRQVDVVVLAITPKMAKVTRVQNVAMCLCKNKRKNVHLPDSRERILHEKAKVHNPVLMPATRSRLSSGDSNRWRVCLSAVLLQSQRAHQRELSFAVPRLVSRLCGGCSASRRLHRGLYAVRIRVCSQCTDLRAKSGPGL